MVDMVRPVIAVVSMEQPYLDMLDELLTDEGYQTITCSNQHNAYAMIYREQPRLVLLDCWLEHPGAGETIMALMELDATTRHIPVILCTTDTHFVREKADVLRAAHRDVLLKPFNLCELLAKIRLFAGSPGTTDDTQHLH